MRTFTMKRTFRQTLTCAPVLFNQFLVGIGWGWTAPTLVKLQRTDSTLQMTTEQISWIVSINEIGRICSPFVSPFIVDNIGRRYSIMVVAGMFVLLWVSHIFVYSVHLICAVRMIFGITNGLHDVVSPIYTTENCSAELRPVIGGMMAIVFIIGKCLELFLATYLTYEITAIVNTVISICSFGLLYFCVETPSFSIMKENHSEAERNLRWLQGDLKPEELSKELEKLKDYVHKEKEKKTSVKTLFSSAENLKCICIVLGLYLISTGTGGIAINPYISMIFSPAGVLTWNHFAFLTEILNFVVLLIAPCFNARIGIRKLLIACYSIMGFCHFCSSMLFYLHNRNYEIEFYPWLIFIFVSSHGLMRSLVGPAQYVVRGELLPLSVRAVGGSMTIIVVAATGFFVVKMFLPITECFGIEMNFLLYALMSILTAIMVYFCLPEMQRKSLVATEKNSKKRIESEDV